MKIMATAVNQPARYVRWTDAGFEWITDRMNAWSYRKPSAAISAAAQFACPRNLPDAKSNWKVGVVA